MNIATTASVTAAEQMVDAAQDYLAEGRTDLARNRLVRAIALIDRAIEAQRRMSDVVAEARERNRDRGYPVW